MTNPIKPFFKGRLINASIKKLEGQGNIHEELWIGL